MTDTPQQGREQSPLEIALAENHLLKTSGIIEVAVRNPSVAEYMAHWESRAEKAEAERDALQADNDRLRAVMQSIADNTCCDGCREAGRVAQSVLKGEPSD